MITSQKSRRNGLYPSFTRVLIERIIFDEIRRFVLVLVPPQSLIIRVLLTILLISPALGTETLLQQDAIPQDLEGAIRPGVVVEKVAHQGEGEKAGLQEGDILLAWSRGDSKGEIESPFDIMDVETEQGRLGGVKLEGLRGTGRQTWSLGPSSWGLTTRPNFSEPLRASYLQALELANRSKVAEIIEATKLRKELVKQSSATTAPWLASWLYFHSAEFLREAKQWKETDEAYHTAVQSAPAANPLVAAQVLQSWANASLERNDWVSAEKYLQQSMTKAENSNSGRLLIALDLNTLGTISLQRGDFGKAEQYYSRTLEIREKLAPGTVLIASSFNNLGVVALQQGALERAEKHFLRALDFQQNLTPGSFSVANSLANLGIVASQRGDLEKAENYFLQALDIRQKLSSWSLSVASSLSNLGTIADEQGDLAKAEEYDRQALSIQEKLAPGSRDVAVSRNEMGLVAWQRGDLARAEEYYRQALEIHEKLAPESLDVGGTLANLANVAHERGDLSKAEQYLRQALEIQQKLAPEALKLPEPSTVLGP